MQRTEAKKAQKVWLISKYGVLPQYGPPNRQYFFSKFINRNFAQTTYITSRSVGFCKVPRFFGIYKSGSYEDLQTVIVNGPNIGLGFSLKRLVSWVVFEAGLIIYGLTNFRKKPDVVIVSSLSLLTVLTGAFFKKIYNCKLIIEVRDIWPDTLAEFSAFNDKSVFYRILKKIEIFGYKHADLVVGSMPRLDMHVKKYGIKNLSCVCVPMGYDPEYYNSAKLGNSLSLAVDEQIKALRKEFDFIVGHAGTIGNANYVHELLEASSSLTSRIAVVIIGDGPLREDLEKKYASSRNVFFLGKVPKRDLPLILGECDLLVNMWGDKQIYQYGVSPNKWIDYMLSSRPILVSYNGYKSIINEADCGWFIQANDSSLLATKIQEISACSTEELDFKGKNGETYCRNNLNYNALAALYWKRIEEVGTTTQQEKKEKGEEALISVS